MFSTPVTSHCKSESSAGKFFTQTPFSWLHHTLGYPWNSLMDSLHLFNQYIKEKDHVRYFRGHAWKWNSSFSSAFYWPYPQLATVHLGDVVFLCIHSVRTIDHCLCYSRQWKKCLTSSRKFYTKIGWIMYPYVISAGL